MKVGSIVCDKEARAEPDTDTLLEGDEVTLTLALSSPVDDESCVRVDDALCALTVASID